MSNKANNKIGRPRVFKTSDDLLLKWNEYKHYCDNMTKPRTEFSQRLGQFFTQDVPAPITYTIGGFCIHNDISEQAFNETYMTNNEAEFLETVTRMHKECELNARMRFEQGAIDTRLHGMWMSNHGYKLPAQQQDDSGIAEAINKLDEVLNKITIGSGDTDCKPEETN